MAGNTVLCRRLTVTVDDYHRMVQQKQKDEIIELILNRFDERYIAPLLAIPAKQKNGFCSMAICCLMIETLESFWRGWGDTRSNSELAFCSFFDRSNNLKDFRGYAREFYKNVRCGILHQAETTGGWKIRRTGVLFDSATVTINATEFHKQMSLCLNDYCASLKREDWMSELWKNLRSKMKRVCNNT